VLTGTY